MNTRLQALRRARRPAWPGCASTHGSTRTPTATAVAARRTRAPTPAWSTPPRVRRSRWSSARTRHERRQPRLRGADLHGAWRRAPPPPAASVGYEGTASDGLTQLDASHTLTLLHVRARRAHRGDRGRHARPRRHGDADARLRPDAGAVRRRREPESLGTPFTSCRGREVPARLVGVRRRAEQAARSVRRARPRARRPAWTSHYYLSANVLKASEDKTYPGAIVASLASPWGQSVPAGVLSNGEPSYFGSYREVFARDLYEAVTGLLADGDVATARAATLFLFDRQQLPNGAMPRNSLLNGEAAPDTGGTQLDETAYPILLAYLTGLGGDKTLYTDHIRPAADFLVANGPSFGVERWEEQTGYSPSTIAAEIAGLTAASAIAAAAGRHRAGEPVPGHGRRLPAQHQELDGDDDRPGRLQLLHPAVQDRRPERGDQLQPRQRRPHPGPAQRARRRLPGTRQARRAAGQRSRRAVVARHHRLAHRGDHAERHRLLPLRRQRRSRQRRRVRRLLPAEPDLVHGTRARRGHRPTPAPATCGRCCPASAPSPTWPRGTSQARSRCSSR